MTALPTLMAASPALAQPMTASSWFGATPLAIALGAGGFAFLAAAWIRTVRKHDRAGLDSAARQISTLRAQVDDYEMLAASSRDLTVMWTQGTSQPSILGQVSAILPQGRHPETLLDLTSWMNDADADAMARAIEGLRVDGKPFELSIKTRDGRLVRAAGWVMGSGAALRLRPAFGRSHEPEPEALLRTVGEPLVMALAEPAAIRGASGLLLVANAAWATLGGIKAGSTPNELLSGPALTRHRAASLPARTRFLANGLDYELSETAIAGGSLLVARVHASAHPAPAAATAQPGLAHLSGVVDALAAPVAVFNSRQELIHANAAYAAFWELDPQLLIPGTLETNILDRLRMAGQLPSEPDFRKWRDSHLESYKLGKPREVRWHLPDRRTINVVSAPAGTSGGVIYVFEDITQRLDLESQNKALSSVQRATLNSLSEGVAVFGTNGRLTLSNPRLSTLWAFPTNELGRSPHIDQLAAAAAKAFPDDGASIWADLKSAALDLTPQRGDQRGRITRADGRLIDYAVTRLPDGQTLMTFVDVTESASYSKVLKERNEALETADRLKDAFVQNVSYELRSPLTNIIGFADLLSSEAFGPLNDRQKAYTDYIRASSATLGVLIDSILDLANVDAGIAELSLERQDVEALVNKACAGIAATFPAVDGQRSLNLKVDIAPNLPVFVADGTRIVQVLYNLLSNAARFTQPGAEIRLSVTGRGRDRILFAIEDPGTGMSEDTAAAFMSREPSMGGRQRAAGLGLAIVKTFVNLHGGTVTVERLKPSGTRVVVNLPSMAVAQSGAAE